VEELFDVVQGGSVAFYLHPLDNEADKNGPFIGWNQTEWENSLNKAH
jgi:hypothetical protein